ncbi:hypothetical protein ISN34_00425 [Xanthomonas translucens pv. translucens]|uniref:HEPN AbiU2-like domain-containing protein n=2 Tax=Xanthomonas campestris pv. translucens TaxID=343 RepID=A0A109HQY1_XANCT|nr:hypothetical protein [Xanthomonas translucens]KWV16872.1 hypothetical protein ATB53_08770 [Xanthomonas translucens]QSQ33630.1 hypothetical protein ISN31_17730 [Xanthomonas translucens pv. translucens]QSQ45455.1 hypothetical protein ISN34_00425 [Xanthomonas translucens pv. translucens]
MTSTQSMEEVHASYVALMGDELGVAFATLHRKLIELHMVWQQYRQLFGSNKETVALLNRTASLFFKIVQDEIWDSVLLGISRMTDPPETRGKKNLTIHSLPLLVDDTALKNELQGLCSAALDQAAFAREHRNKRIAHQDHEYAADRAANSLSGISRERVETMLAALCTIMNRLNLHFKNSTTLYDNFTDESGARVLISKLRNFERLKAASGVP